MKRITLDAELKQRLGNLSEDVELCDERGYVVAHVQRSTPWTDPENWVQVTPELTDEEWERLKNSDDPGISTQELLDHLKGRR